MTALLLLLLLLLYWLRSINAEERRRRRTGPWPRTDAEPVCLVILRVFERDRLSRTPDRQTDGVTEPLRCSHHKSRSCSRDGLNLQVSQAYLDFTRLWSRPVSKGHGLSGGQMAGSGVAIRLHEFREPWDPKEEAPGQGFRPKVLRPGRDTQGIYPGQLGRVHTVNTKHCGGAVLQTQNPRQENYQQSFDIQTLKAHIVLRQGPGAVNHQCPAPTAYQQDFGHQSCFCNRRASNN